MKDTSALPWSVFKLQQRLKSGRRLSKKGLKCILALLIFALRNISNEAPRLSAEQTVQEGAIRSLQESPTCLFFLKTGRQKSLAIPATVQIKQSQHSQAQDLLSYKSPPISSASLSALLFCGHNSLRIEEGHGL